jgi:glycosyltransferase involved in cell wall biosynthesis
MTVNCTLPVFNEEDVLKASVTEVVSFLRAEGYAFDITIADNGSTDATPAIAKILSEAIPEVSFISLSAKGRGRALRRSWDLARADILCYMDIDLSTNLKCFGPLYRAIKEEGADLAIGSRLVLGSEVRRGAKREIISRVYNWMVKRLLRLNIADVQCGFKAIRRETAISLLPFVKSEEWFFDTELLYLANKRGYRIREIPVCWNEGRGSKVKVIPTVAEDLAGIWRLKREH